MPVTDPSISQALPQQGHVTAPPNYFASQVMGAGAAPGGGGAPPPPPPQPGGQLPTVPQGTPGFNNAAPASAPAFNVNDPRTWGGGGSVFGPSSPTNPDGSPVGYDPTSNMHGRQVWGNTDNAAKPWETNAQAGAETRNNFYYGGSATGAQDFNNQIGQAGSANDQRFNGDSNNALGLQGQAQQYGQQYGTMGAGAASRDPSRFLDTTSLVNNDSDRNSQLNAIGGLNSYIQNGPGPSAAQGQLNQATDANMANSLALARSGRGLGQSQSALRQAIGQNAATGQQAANQSAVLKAQENQNWQTNQLNAYGQIGNIAGTARAGDIARGSYTSGTDQAGSNANDTASLGYGNLVSQFGSQQLGAGQLGASIDQNRANSDLGYYGLMNNVNGQQLQANQNYEGQQLNSYLGQRQPIQQNGTDYTPYLAAGGAIIGGLVGGPGGAAAGGAVGSAAGSAVDNSNKG